MDETSKQQVKETRLGRPPRPGAAGSYDYAERNGVSNLFMLFAPLEGWRRVEVTERENFRADELVLAGMAERSALVCVYDYVSL